MNVKQKDRQCSLSNYQSVNGLMITHALGHLMQGYLFLVPMNQRVLKNLSKDHSDYDAESAQILDWLSTLWDIDTRNV